MNIQLYAQVREVVSREFKEHSTDDVTHLLHDMFGVAITFGLDPGRREVLKAIKDVYTLHNLDHVDA